MERLSVLTPGFLAFLGYYEILSGLSFPLNFTVDRVTNTYRFQSPLLGGLELDLLAYTIAASHIAYIEDKPRYRLLHIILAFASISSLLLSQVLGLTSIAYIALGSASLSSALLYVHRRRSFARLLPGLLVSMIFIEVAALVAMSTYYIFGGWIPQLFHMALQERLIWAPLEWLSIPLFIAVMWSSFAKIILGRPLLKPLKIGITEASRERKGSKLLLILALSLTVILIGLPHLPAVNPEFKPVSVDTLPHEAFFEEAESQGLAKAMSKIGARPTYLWGLYHAWLASARNTVLLMDLIHPLLALMLLTVASFYAGRKLHCGRGAEYMAMLVPLGYAVPAFISGGFQANSLALTTAILALTANPKSRTGQAKLTILMTLTALIHPWTHLMYSAALIAYSFRDRRRLLYSLSAIAASYAVSHIIDYYLVSIHVSAVPAQTVLKYSGFYLVGNCFDAVRLWGWNTLSNPVYLSASILATDWWTTSVMAVAAPLTLILPASLIFRLILNIPLQHRVSRGVKDYPVRYQALIFLVLLVRVLGNLSGLTPLEALLPHHQGKG